MTIAENIKNRREEYDLTQAELAKRIGVTPSYVNYVESGTRIPSVPVLIKLADALNISTDEILGRKVG